MKLVNKQNIFFIIDRRLPTKYKNEVTSESKCGKKFQTLRRKKKGKKLDEKTKKK